MGRYAAASTCSTASAGYIGTAASGWARAHHATAWSHSADRAHLKARSQGGRRRHRGQGLGATRSTAGALASERSMRPSSQARNASASPNSSNHTMMIRNAISPPPSGHLAVHGSTASDSSVAPPDGQRRHQRGGLRVACQPLPAFVHGVDNGTAIDSQPPRVSRRCGVRVGVPGPDPWRPVRTATAGKAEPVA